MREAVVPKDPKTPSQIASRKGFGAVAQGWRDLSDEAFAAWEAAGGYRRYMSLTRKWRSVHPDGAPPIFPPAHPFLGDAVRLALDSPSPGLLATTADRANSGGVVTEILLQPLAAPRCKPKTRNWRSAGFFPFDGPGARIEIPVAPGAWAVAARFVDEASGQATSDFVLGSVAVAPEPG